MNTKEKILLVQLLLQDIRGNWGWERTGSIGSRAEVAKDLCEQIASEIDDRDYMTLASSCDKYIKSSKDWGDWDGRWFRETFPNGYENMDSLHGLDPTYMDKSNEFKILAKSYLTYPEYRFDDWKDVVFED